MRPTIIVCVLLAALGRAGCAQTSFDAASVKASAPNDPYEWNLDPGRLTAHDLDLKELIQEAFGLKAYQVQAPGWMEQLRYDIDAETQQPLPPKKMLALLQPFLIRQFGLVTHRATRTVNVYDLAVDTGGAKLKAAADDTAYIVLQLNPARGATLRGTGTMGDLAAMLTREAGRPVLDATGLHGAYAFTLHFSPGPEAGLRMPPQAGAERGSSLPGSATGAATPAAPSLFSALAGQLGLKLVPRKGPIAVLVIDRANKTPRGN